MSKYKDIEGAVPVNGDITPITRKKIEQVDSSQWNEMTVSELYDQRIILSNRMSQASMSGNPAILQQIECGLRALDAIISERSQGSDEINLI